MGRKAAVAIAAALIVCPIAALASYKRWLDTRIVTPLDIPVSLSRGKISENFYVNLTGQYEVDIAADYPYGYLDECPQYGNHAVLRPHLRLSKDGAQIADTYGAEYFSIAHLRAAEKGTYHLDVDVLSDASCLNPGNPRLRVISEGFDYYTNLFQTAVLASLVPMFAGLALSFYVGIVTVRGREKPALAISDREEARIATGIRLRRPKPSRLLLGLPPFPVLAATVFALLVFVGMILVGILFTPFPSKGLYVSLNVRPSVAGDLNSAMPPVVVRIQSVTPSVAPKLYVNSTPVEWDGLGDALKDQLKLRAEWVVYIDGDSNVPWQNVAQVADVAKGLHAKIVLLTPETRRLVEPESAQEKPAGR